MSGSGVAAALEAAPLRSPVYKAFHIVAVLPGKVEELASRQVGGLFAEESFKPPPDIRTPPGVESVASGCVPIVVKCLEHLLRNGRNSPSPLRQDSRYRQAARKDARERAPNSFRASPRSLYTGDPVLKSYRPLFFLLNASAQSSRQSYRAASPSGLCPLSA